jgi:hypothetical protein
MPDGTSQYFAVTVRPLLPFEKIELNEDRMSDITAPDSEKPNFKLTCHPSDGVLPIPTLSNP